MVNGTRAPGTDQRPSLGALVADIATEVSQLVRGEIELAKAELKESAKAGSTGGALLAVAGLLIAMVGLLTTWAAVSPASLTSVAAIALPISSIPASGSPFWASRAPRKKRAL